MNGLNDQLGPSPDRPETPQVTGDGSFSAPDAWALLYTRRGVLIGRIQEITRAEDGSVRGLVLSPGWHQHVAWDYAGHMHDTRKPIHVLRTAWCESRSFRTARGVLQRVRRALIAAERGRPPMRRKFRETT